MKIKTIRIRFFSVVIVSALMILFMLNTLFINLMRDNRDLHIEKYRTYLREATQMRLELYVNAAIIEIEVFKEFTSNKAAERIRTTLEIIEEAILIDNLEGNDLREVLVTIQQYNVNQNIFFYYPQQELYRRMYGDGRIRDRRMNQAEFEIFLEDLPVAVTQDLGEHGVVGVYFNIDWFEDITKEMAIRIIETLSLDEREFILIDEIVENKDGMEFTRRIMPRHDTREGRRYIDENAGDPHSTILKNVRENGEDFDPYYYSSDRGLCRAYWRLYPAYDWIVIAGIQVAKEQEMFEREEALIMQKFSTQVDTMIGVSFFAIIIILIFLMLLEKFLFEKFIQYTEDLELNVKDYTDKIYSLEKNSQIDEVTLIYNRRYMEAALNRRFEKSKEYALMMIDIDFFKKVNDTYGHDAGDFVLRQVARRIKNNLLLGDVVTRYGGEEFLIIVNERNKEGIFDYAEQIRKEIEKNIFLYDEQKIFITVSLGVSLVNPQDETYMDAFNRADRNLYTSKQNGRNQVTLDEV